MFDPVVVQMMLKGLGETLYMTLVGTCMAYVLGLPLGIILVVTDKDGIRPSAGIYAVLGFIVNFIRSIPFLIGVLLLAPVIRIIAGSVIGPTAMTVGLVILAAPFVARLVESSLKEIDRGVIEAARSMGASSTQIIYKVMLVEALPSLLVGVTISVTTILGYSAMAGILGGGGLGDIAIRYGAYRYETDIMLVTVVILVILVQVFQEIGMRISKGIDKRIT